MLQEQLDTYRSKRMASEQLLSARELFENAGNGIE